MSEYMPDKLAEMTLKMIGDRWKVLIIQNLMGGTKRFGELKKELGDITQKVLTSNLRLLEEKGILIRKVYAQIPPRVDYTLTQLGYELKPVIDSMIEWAEEYRRNMAQILNIDLAEKQFFLIFYNSTYKSAVFCCSNHDFTACVVEGLYIIKKKREYEEGRAANNQAESEE